MSGTIVVQNIQGPTSGANANRIIIPSGQTLDASAGFVPPAGNVIRMGTAKHSTYSATSTNNTWILGYTFTIPGVSSGNSLYMTYSVNDLVEAANFVYFRIRRESDNNILVTWGRNTNSNGGWRGIRADASLSDDSPVTGTNTYNLDYFVTSGTAYLNYPSGNNDTASFLTWWEVKG